MKAGEGLTESSGVKNPERCPNCRGVGTFAELPEQSRRLPNGRLLFTALVVLYVPLVVFGPFGRWPGWWLRVIFGVGLVAAGLLMVILPELTRGWFERIRYCRSCGLAMVMDGHAHSRRRRNVMVQLLLFPKSYLVRSPTDEIVRSSSDFLNTLLGWSSRSRFAEQMRAGVKHLFRIR